MYPEAWKRPCEIADLMKRIVQAIVDSSEAVTIEVSASGTLSLRVAPGDMRVLIGANGRMARAPTAVA